MKCYNNFNDMFNAQVNDGARMNVFNGVAETSGLKDLVNGYDLPYVVRVITGLSGDFAVAVQDDDGGKFVLKDKIDSSNPIHDNLKYAGIDNIIDTLNTAIDKARKAGKSIDTGRWSDKLLQDNLNKCAKDYGYSYTWDKAGTGTFDTKAKKDAEARAKKEKKDAEAKSKPTTKKIKGGVRATGILADNGYDRIVKFGFVHGVPCAEAYTDTGSKLGSFPLTDLFTDEYINYLRSGDADVPNITDNQFATMIETKMRSGDKARKIDEVYWLPGNKKCSYMKTKLKSDLSKRESEEKKFEKDDRALEERAINEERKKMGLIERAISRVLQRY